MESEKFGLPCSCSQQKKDCAQVINATNNKKDYKQYRLFVHKESTC